MDNKRRWYIEKSANFLGCAVYALSAAVLVIDFENTHRISSLLMLVMRLLISVLFLVRPPPKHDVNTNWRDWAFAIGGTGFYLMLRPAPEVHDFIIMHAVQVIGVCISIAGLLSLNQSFGIVAANRGVKTSGIYKYIRHPIYAGYLIEGVAFLAQNISIWNIIVILISTLFQFQRLFIEEEFLSRDPAYVEYMKRTPGRILPVIF